MLLPELVRNTFSILQDLSALLNSIAQILSFLQDIWGEKQTNKQKPKLENIIEPFQEDK